jgi:hypothetical protein
MTVTANPVGLEVASRAYLLALPDIWFERVWNRREERAIDELYVPAGRAHGLMGEQYSQGPEAFKQFHRMVLAGFPDLKVQPLAKLVDGDLVAGRWVATGKHLGEFMGRTGGELRGPLPRADGRRQVRRGVEPVRPARAPRADRRPVT